MLPSPNCLWWFPPSSMSPSEPCCSRPRSFSPSRFGATSRLHLKSAFPVRAPSPHKFLPVETGLAPSPLRQKTGQTASRQESSDDNSLSPVVEWSVAPNSSAIDIPAPAQPAEPAARPIIAVHDLVPRYQDRLALHGVSFE